jgi:hypothetical protein
MQDKINPFASAPTCCHISNVTFEKGELLPLLWLNAPLDFFEVPQVPGAKIINAFDDLIMLQQRLEQSGTDKARDAGY